MSLQREAILQRARDLLTDATDAGSQVHVNKAEPDQRHTLPSIGLYGLSENRGELQEVAPVRFVRRMKLAVELKVADPGSSSGSTRMNRLAEQVERILLRHPNLPDAGGEPLAEDVRWTGAELVIDPDSRSIVVGLAIAFEVDYLYEPEAEAPANVRDFLLAHVEHDVGSDVNAVDDVELPGP